MPKKSRSPLYNLPPKPEEKRHPHQLHPKEEQFYNFFFINVNQSDAKETRALLENKKTQFMFVLDSDKEMVLGIENLFAQSELLSPTSESLRKSVREMREKIIDDIYPIINNRILDIVKRHNLSLTYTPTELKSLLVQVIEERDTLSSSNEKLKHLIRESIPGEKKIDHFILQQIKLGHPSLLAGEQKEALIAGELEFVKGKWILTNKSGRYGRPTSGKTSLEDEIYQNVKYLLISEEILKLKGISKVESEVYVKEKFATPREKVFTQLGNEALKLYRETGQINFEPGYIRHLFDKEADMAKFVIRMSKLSEEIEGFKDEHQEKSSKIIKNS